MEGTSNEHDRWMSKITDALRSFRTATQLKAQQAQGRRPESEPQGDGTERDRG